MGYRGKELGIYAGGLAAAFCAAQFCSSIAWGRFSDIYGRKLAIILGTIGAALGMLVFGTSKTYTQALIGRIVSGLLSGNVGVLKSFLTEITDETNRGTGFSYMSTAWSLGCIIAPLAGGLLCRPAVKYPYAFSSDGFFGQFPYVLPCLLCTIFSLLSSLMCIIFMTESRREKGSIQMSQLRKSGVSTSTAPTTPSASLRSLNSQSSMKRTPSINEKHAHNLEDAKMSPMSAANRLESNTIKPPSLSRRLKNAFGASNVNGSAKSPRYEKLGAVDSDNYDDDDGDEIKECDIDDKLPYDSKAGADTASLSLLKDTDATIDDDETEGKPEQESPRPLERGDSDMSSPRSRRLLRKISSKTVVHTYGDEDICTCSIRMLCCFRCNKAHTNTSQPVYMELQSLSKQSSLSHTETIKSGDADTDIEGGVNHLSSSSTHDVNEARSSRNIARMMKMVLGKLTLGYTLPSSKQKVTKTGYNKVGDTDELLQTEPRSDSNEDDDDDSKNVLRQKTVLLAVGTYGMLAMGFMLLDETIPLFLKLDDGLGGMSFDSSEIGFLLSICGGAVLIFAYWGLPWLMKVYSKAFLYKISIIMLIPTVIGWPILAELKLNLFQKWFSSSVNNIVTWVLLSLIGVMRGVTAVIAFTVVTIQVSVL